MTLKEVVSNIKLTSKEKQLLVSLVGYVIFILLMRYVIGPNIHPVAAVFVVVIFLVWSAANIIGIAYVLWNAAKYFYENLPKFSTLHKIVVWFRTDDLR